MLGDEFINQMMPFTFMDDDYMEFKDMGKLDKVSIEQIHVGMRILLAL